MYENAEDPWGFTSRWYERRKYAITLATLPDERYGDAFEPGCSIGVLSELLARRCDRLLCTDVARDAVARAGKRLAGLNHVRVEQRRVPQQWPPGEWDLIVLSELLYYLSEPDSADVLTRARESLRPDGILLAAHWRHPVADYPRQGDDVHRQLAATPGLVRLVAHVEPDFVLEVYQRDHGTGTARSVAARTGLL